MKLGFIRLNAPGHLNPMTALARQLQARNVILDTGNQVSGVRVAVSGICPNNQSGSAIKYGHTVKNRTAP